MTTNQILPGSTICILGAGQLGKMSLVAAHQLGFHTIVWAPDSSPGVMDPAMEMATHRLRQPFDCRKTLEEVCARAHVITTEWENVPLFLIEALEYRGIVVRPGSKVLAVAQSRQREKLMAEELGIPVTEHVFLPKERELSPGTEDWSRFFPGILKTNGGGYDGKGQWTVTTFEELQSAWAKAKADCLLEKRVDLAAEMSVLVAGTAGGEVKVSDIVENTHKGGILDTSVWPLQLGIEDDIGRMARAVASHLELEGILVLEFFQDQEGSIYFNEMAPRPHNSFHGTIEAAFTSQFEQHVRAICNLPLGRVKFHTPFTMLNLIGGEWDADWKHYLTDHDARLHLYGKAESRPGRKMGHVTVLSPR